MFVFQKWLGSAFPEDVWAWWLLMNWLQLQFTPCEALPSIWIGFAWQYSQACAHPCCLCTFSYPISSFQSTLYLMCFDTALLEQQPLSVMTLCDLPSSHAHLISKDASVISRKSPITRFQMERHLIHRALDHWQATQFALRITDESHAIVNVRLRSLSMTQHRANPEVCLHVLKCAYISRVIWFPLKCGQDGGVHS